MKVYTALLTQQGSNDPSPMILENSLGQIVWTRAGEGIYEGILSGAFPDGKTFCLINESIGDSSTSERVTICRASNDQINVTTATGGNPTDGLLYNHSLEIRVYD